METGTIDTYDTDSVYPSTAQASNIVDTNKYHTQDGTWSVSPDELQDFIDKAGYDTSKYHPSEVKLEPSDEEKMYISSHREDNSSITTDGDYTGETYEPGSVNVPYVYMERNWNDIYFITNDNTDITSSTKATIGIN